MEDLQIRQLELKGTWELKQADDLTIYPAEVPGSVHHALLQTGAIDDPYWRLNELKTQWIAEHDWTYSRQFSVSTELLQQENIDLVCDGLDTIATIRINGHTVATTDNMFVGHRFNVKEMLVEGENTIEIHFQSPNAYAQNLIDGGLADEDKLRRSLVPLRTYLRKMPCNFGWDWGPKLTTCGIWRDIRLEAWSLGRIDTVHIEQQHHESWVELSIAAYVQGSDKLRAEIEIDFGGQCQGTVSAPVQSGKANATLELPSPRLWYPNGLGEQPLYDLSVTLCDEAGHVIANENKRIGLRTITLIREPDEEGESFGFAVNGIPVFMKGSNWIPSSAVLSGSDNDRVEPLLQAAVDTHQNMIRIWGGGVYESDFFYEFCDERGLLVWQDFMFACTTIPTFLDPFMDSFRAEVQYQVRRLRHHPCIANWCGNNEIESKTRLGEKWTRIKSRWTSNQMPISEYQRIFDDLIPRCLAVEDPTRPYWPASPHSPIGDRRSSNTAHCGDSHTWWAWFDDVPIEDQRKSTHRFISEFGFQSLPDRRTVEAYTTEADRNLCSRVMEHHQRCRDGNETLIQVLMQWFRLPESFDDLIYSSQILHGLALKYAIEHWRRQQPRTMGSLIWQLNDCWPGTTWATIDFFGRWKASHYIVRRLYEPVLLSIREEPDGRADLHVSNHHLEAVDVTVRWRLLTTDGTELRSGACDGSIASQSNEALVELDFAADIAEHGADKLLLTAEAESKGQFVSRNFALFCKPKHLQLARPQFSTELCPSDEDGSFRLTILSDVPALWVWLSLEGADAQFSDNSFYLDAASREIEVRPWKPLSLKEVRTRLTIRSL